MDIAQQTSRSVPTLGAEAVAICRLEQAGSDVRALSEVVGGCNPTQHDMNEQRAPKTPLTPSHFTVSFLRVGNVPPLLPSMATPLLQVA